MKRWEDTTREWTGLCPNNPRALGIDDDDDDDDGDDDACEARARLIHR